MEELLNGVSVPAIAAIVYWIVNLIKYTAKGNEKVMNFIPLISTVLGIVCGVVAFLAVPSAMPVDNIYLAIIVGGASGMSATGFNQIIKQTAKYIENKEEK